MAKIVFFTGAGISAPSGIKTFRASDGLWNEHKVEDVATLQGFYKNPVMVNNFYNERRKDITLAMPNIAHKMIAELSKEHEVNIITQNIDDLHERAGSNNVIHLHGLFNQMKCLMCQEKFIFNSEWKNVCYCPFCLTDFKNVRPDIVWFGESLNLQDFNKAEDICREAELFVQVGTSANVAPANKLIKRVKVRRKKVEINLVRSVPNRPFMFHNYYIGNVINSFPDFVKDIPELLKLNEKGIFKKY